MAEAEFPRIGIDYSLVGENRDATLDFVLAGKEYGKTRPVEENFTDETQESDTVNLITFSRNVIQPLSYAEVEHETDVMQTEIESRIITLGWGTLLATSRAGHRRPSGRVPDQE